MPLCPALLSGNAASMTGSTLTPDGGKPLVIEASSCLGSKCVKWVPEIYSFTEGTYRAMMTSPDPIMTDEERGHFTGSGWCSDNLRSLPFEDPNVVLDPDGGEE
jgi:hypothetical protein